jgi:hypothetical protein
MALFLLHSDELIRYKVYFLYSATESGYRLGFPDFCKHFDVLHGLFRQQTVYKSFTKRKNQNLYIFQCFTSKFRERMSISFIKYYCSHNYYSSFL